MSSVKAQEKKDWEEIHNLLKEPEKPRISKKPHFIREAEDKGLKFEEHTPSRNKQLKEEAHARYKERSKNVRKTQLFADKDTAFHTPSAITDYQEADLIVKTATDLYDILGNIGWNENDEKNFADTIAAIDSLGDDSAYADRMDEIMDEDDKSWANPDDFAFSDNSLSPNDIPIKF